MSVLNRIAYFQNRRDETPDRELAEELAEAKDREGIREIAENLWNKNERVQGDCLKVLYWIGYSNPELIADYVGDFLKLPKSRNNQLVWASMITLSTIAEMKAEEIYRHYDEIKKAMENGSVITVDNAVKTLAIVASKKEEYRKEIFPYLLRHLQTCRPRSVPQHAESTLAAVNAQNKDEFIQVLRTRMPEMTAPQAQRLRKTIREAEKR